MNARVLVVDDEKLIRWSLCQRLSEEGYACTQAEDGAAAMARVEDTPDIDLALLDLRLPDTDGVTLLKRMRDVLPELPVIIITAHSTIDSAVEAMKLGARDYIAKPFNMDELVFTVGNVLRAGAMERRIRTQVSQQKARFGLPNLIGSGDIIRQVKDLVRRVAQSKTTTVLLLGESGTGKDMLARAIHYESDRVDMPFMNITCTALPESLLESELFGYEKGAFTDAKEQKRGLFELANGGTVFLDEIGDMSGSLQSKLLRVLEDKAFRRIGGTADINVDVRIIAATNRDLGKEIEKGGFREDLYYRLSIMPIFIPPLRERREDVPELARHFLMQCNREFHREIGSFSPEVLRKLHSYSWPGNVRELRNVVERAVLLCTGNTITPNDVILGRSALGNRSGRDETTVRLPEKGCDLAEIEGQLVRQALERTDWNQTRAAKLLNISRDQIRYKMQKYSVTHPMAGPES